MFCFLRANHASTSLKKVLSWKISRQVYFIYLFPRRLKLEKSLETCCVKFFCLSWHLSEKSILFGKQGLIKCTSFEYKTSRLVTISLLISALNNRVLLFFLGKLFHKSTRKYFFLCLHSQGWENSWPLCKPSTASWVCITVSNSPNPSCVYIRLCKHRKRFLLLKWFLYKLCRIALSSNIEN